MIAYAAIDIHDGRVVQLVGGDTAETRITLQDPVAVAREWVEAGFRALHIVDLDAALGTGSNRDIITEILRDTDAAVQIGGGIRADEDVAYWMNAGAEVVIGTRAFRDRAWLQQITNAYPDRIVVAADVREGVVATHGWRSSSTVPVLQYVNELDTLPLRGVLVTDIDREGRMSGADIELFRSAAATTRHPLIASGGIATTAELGTLADAGVSGVILGMSLYTGGIDTSIIAAEFAE